MQCFPLLLVFPRFLVSSFPHFLVFSFSRFLVSRFGFSFVFRSVSHFKFCFVSHSVSCFGFRSVSCSVSRFRFRSVSRSVSHIGSCSTILNSCPTSVPVLVPDSVSVSPSLRQRLPLLLASLPCGVALYRRQRIITDSHSARPCQVRFCGSRPAPLHFVASSVNSPTTLTRSYLK